MAGYSGTPLYQKLGIKPDSRVLVHRTDSSIMEQLANAPFPIERSSTTDGSFDVIVAHFSDYQELNRMHSELIAALETAGGLWIAWSNRASKIPTDISEDRLRDLFLSASPMVDNKVCAIDEKWSALRFVRRLKFR